MTEKKMEEGQCAKDQSNEPKDGYRVAYAIHFLLGAGNLLPWNALITAIDYFGQLYPARNIEKVFAAAYMGSSMLVLVLMVCWGRWRAGSSFRVRMNLGFSMFLVSLMVAPVIDWAQCTPKSKQGTNSAAYRMTVAAVVVCGLADGLIGGSLVGFAGRMPKEYMQAVFAGTACSGVLVSIFRIVTKASLSQTLPGLRKSAHLYFLVSSTIILACIVCCNLLFKLKVVQHHYTPAKEDEQSPIPRFWNILRKIRWAAFGVFTIYTVTLSIFPGFIADNLESEILKDWYPILLITLYNVCDFIGKSLTAIYALKSIGKATWGCIGRLLFYPLFLVCIRGPRFLRTEGPMVVLTCMLGVTNGYLTSVVMILAPKSVPAVEAEMSAIVMAVFLGLGLVSGSVLGWVWVI